MDKDEALLNHIEINPDIMVGKPVRVLALQLIF